MPTLFTDTDVVIASLLSTKGASYYLLRNTQVTLYISSISLKEIQSVGGRLGIAVKKLESLVAERFKVVVITGEIEAINKKYKEYVLDLNDGHIVAGVVEAKVQFLLTYNNKHFRIDKIKKDFNVIVSTPAVFLQYLRSL